MVKSIIKIAVGLMMLVTVVIAYLRSSNGALSSHAYQIQQVDCC